MITLYHAPKSRSTRMIFLLEEIGAPYEIKTVTIRRGDGSGAIDPANPHPHAKVPAIRHGSELVFESSAIVAYLTDTFPDAGLAPKPGQAGRGQYLTMLAYYGDVIEPAFVSKFLKMDVPRGTAGWVAVEEVMPTIDKLLTTQPYIAGKAFTGADILYATTFGMFAQNPMMPKLASVEAYVKRCLDRPAYARAMAKDAG
ncbi:MAG: glutathione S-transferase family protein [Alphaproteobacteria bacterium]|jgi:glutathione S-transferase|nr:glutathione S-transferase family protein [Alphaproteobacteria bacterium]